jgi:hypothetical protein
MLKSQQSKQVNLKCTTMPDFNLVKQQLLNYFNGAAKITNDHKPPGNNVSDGDFGALIATDPTISACYIPITIADQRLNALFKDSFQNCYYKLSSLSLKTRLKVPISPSQEAALIAEKYIITPSTQLMTIITDITKIVTLDVTTLTKLYTDGQAYWDAVQKENFRTNGRFANGWIAIDLKKAADAANLALPVITSANDQTDKLVSIMSAFYTKVSSWSHGTTTQDDGNAPWLKADWETQFNLACSATASSIAAI